MSRNKVIIHNSIFIYIRLLIVSLVGIFTSKYVLKALGASDYGLFIAIAGIITIVSFLNVIMISTTYRFIAIEIGRGEILNINKIVNASKVIHLVISLIFLIIIFIFGFWYIENHLNVDPKRIEDAKFILFTSSISSFCSIILIPYQGLLVALEKFKIISVVEIFKSLINFSAIYFIINYSGDKLILYTVLFSISNAIPPLIYYLYVKINYYEYSSWRFIKEKKIYLELINFSIWIMLGASASMAEVEGSSLMINSFFGTIYNASFGIASNVNNIIKLFSQGITQTIIPQITKSYSVGEDERVKNLVMFTSKYSFFLLLIPSLPVLLQTDYILKIWLNTPPPFTNVFIKIMIINALINSLSSGIPAVVHASGKIKYFQIIQSFILLSGLPISFYLYQQKYSPETILVVFTITSIISFISQNFMLKKLISFDLSTYFKKSLLRIIYVSISVFPLFLFPEFFKDKITNFFFTTIFCEIFLLTAFFNFGLEKKEKNYFKAILISLFKKK